MTALGRANRETAQARNFYIIVGLAQQAKYEVAPLSTDRLDSWKDIAAYLKRSERTVRRWEEQHGLPVHRVGDQAGASVFAYKSELDAGWQSYNETGECTATQANSLRQTTQELQLETGIRRADSRLLSAQKPLIICSLAA